MNSAQALFSKVYEQAQAAGAAGAQGELRVQPMAEAHRMTTMKLTEHFVEV